MRSTPWRDELFLQWSWAFMSSLKDQGNAEFASEQYLKAAATYTKAIKQDPENAVLYSNRSAALLKLQKVAKALADAEQCLKLRPEWEKGYFRKGAALEAADKFDEAVGVYQQAARLPDAGPAASSKASALSKQLQRQRAQARKASRDEGSSFNFASKEDACGRADVVKKPTGRRGAAQATPNGHTRASNAGVADGAGRIGQAPVTGVISTDEEYEAAKQQAANSTIIPISNERIEDFMKDVRELTEAEMQKAPKDIQPAVYFLPGRTGPDGKEQMGRVQVTKAFESPETLQQCTQFLRQYAEDSDAHAACAVIPKASVAFPQVWKSSGWQHGNEDGVFLQLESLRPLRRIVFIPLKSKQAAELKDTWLLERLFR